MALAPIRRIYEITVEGQPIVFYTRFIGEVGRDIAAVKYALGDVYQADIQNRSEDDGTLIGGQWFACDGDDQPLTPVQLSTFDKRLQKSLMSYQLNNQFLIMNYYWHSFGLAAAIEKELDLPQALERMIYLFDSDYGTINEATIAILHGWRPGSDASNKSFQTTGFNPIEQIPEFMYDMYVSNPPPFAADVVYKIYDFEESKNNDNNVATRFDNEAISFRKWKDRVVSNAEEEGEAIAEIRRLRDIERYIEYKTYALAGSGFESELYVATKEVLQILEEITPEDISPEQREALIASAVEPNHLTQVVPFQITNFKIGFFDRTDFSFQNLPNFDGISEEDKSKLESSALEKVLEFYNKALPETVDPELIKFVDLRAPSLRPGDVYRAFFHINKQILDSLANVQFGESTNIETQSINLRDSIANRLQDLENLTQNIESEFCTGGKTLDEEQTRIQYEKYRSFASKKKLEISREITQKVIKSRDPSNNIDGIDVDLGIFGRGHLDQREINSLIGNLTLSAGSGISDFFSSEDGEVKDGGPTHWNGTYDDLLEKISEVSDAFLEFSKDLENYNLKQTSSVPFSADREVRFLREFTDGVQNLLRTANAGRGENQQIPDLDSETAVKIQFTPVEGLGSKLEKILVNNTEQIYPIKGKSKSYYPNALTRNRTVHYIRNIDRMYKDVEEDLFDYCEEPEAPVGTGAAYILRYTVDVLEGSAKKSSENFFHAWASNVGDNIVDTLGLNENDFDDSKGPNLIPSPTFGFEKTLPSLGENCIEKPKKVRKLIKNTFDMKRILCEYIACLKLPGVQAQVPKIPKLRWPKLPTLNIDAWKNLRENAEEIGARLACMFLKGILDILNSPMCEEAFTEGVFGAAADQAPEVQRALASGFLDTGIPIDKQQNAKDLIDALMEMLSPRELCALLSGEQVNDEVYQIVRTIAQALGIGAELQTREQISNFFIPIGLFVGPALCDELSRFESKIETCDEIYSLASQIRSAAAKGESVSPEEIQKAIDHAENQLQSKADAMNFLFSGGSLQDLLPDFTSLENNPAFSKPDALTEKAALQAAKSVLGLAEMSFISSLNGYVESFFQKQPRTTGPGDPEYDYTANMIIQRAICNLKAFAEVDLDISDFASEETSIRLRRALLVLCNDYEKVPDSENPDQLVYTLSDSPNPGGALPVLLKNSLLEKYSLQNIRSEEDARLYGTFSELQPIWAMMFPIQAGDLGGSTRTISSLQDWVKSIFFGGDLAPADISTLNINYLNKINQIIERLQIQITSNIEKAFTTKNENLFLSGVKEFYDPQEVQDGKANDLLTVKMEDKLHTTLKHPVEALRKSMQVEVLEDFGPGDTPDIARTKIIITDDFFLGAQDGYEVQYCEEIPQHLKPEDTSVLPRPAAYRKALINILKTKYQAYKIRDSVPTINLNASNRSFLDAYEGLYEQIATGVRTSRIFTDPVYRERMDLKLRGKYYFDPKSGCFKNSKSNPKFGVLNFEKLVTEQFPYEYLKEFSSPLNSPLTEDYSTPGAFEKAMMNVTFSGFVRMCLIEVLLKGALTISVWDIDFIRKNKIYRDYLVEFVNNQMDLQAFFTDNAQFRDETIQRLSGTSNIQSGRKKIILKELDSIISSLAKEVFENDENYDFSQWFMDSIPFVQTPNTRALDGKTWLTNVDFEYAQKLKNNNFVFLEDYMRVNGSIRSFRSSREQIAQAQLETLQENMLSLRRIDRSSQIPGGTPDSSYLSQYNIGDASSVSLEGTYNDTDDYANTELMSVSEFSELIKSLVDNNKELSRYFHKVSGKVYSPGNKTHGVPNILRHDLPSRIIKRTRQHVTFDKANIFSLLLKKTSSEPLGDGEKAIDKFVSHHYDTMPQVKDAFLFNVLTTGDYGETAYQTYSDPAAGELIRKAFRFAKKSEDRYYVIADELESAFTKQDEYNQVETETEFNEKDIYDKYNFKTRTGSTFDTSPEKIRTQAPGYVVNPAYEFDNLNFKAGNFKSGDSDPALKERNNSRRITHASAGTQRTLFTNPKDKSTKEQYDLILEENPDLPSEIWEETVIDLVGDSAPIFMFPGDSGWNPGDHMTDEQKTLIGTKLKKCHYWLHRNGQWFLDGWTTGLRRSLYRFNQNSPEVADPKLAHPTMVFAWDDAEPTGGLISDESEAAKTKAYPLKPFGSAYGTKWSAYSAYDQCFGHNTRVFYKNDLTFKKNPRRGNYDISYETEQLTPNEYKIPLRILITQVKNNEGKVLKVFVRYVLPQFLDFENEDLNEFRAQRMTDACVDTLDGWNNFVATSFRKVMTGWYASGDGRFESNKDLLTNPTDPLTSGIKYDIRVMDCLRQGGADTAHPIPPFTVGTDRRNNNRDNSWWGSRQAAWLSTSKLYSHACRIEADNKEGHFQNTDSYIDQLFSDPGSLLRKPGNSSVDPDPINAYKSFRRKLLGSFDGSPNTHEKHTSPDVLNDDHSRNLDMHIKEMFMYYNLSKHNLYDHGLHDTLRSFTGIVGESKTAVPNSGTASLQTIGNLVSWFSQKRVDSFWGKTSISSNRWRTVSYQDSEIQDQWHESLPSGQHRHERLWELQEAENNHCGPSLFYNDMRAPTTTMIYNALHHFSNAERKKFAVNLYPESESRFRGMDPKHGWSWLLKNASQINAYAYFYNVTFQRHYDENMTEMITNLFSDSDGNLVDPGHDTENGPANFYLQTANHDQDPASRKFYFYWNLSEAEAKSMNMYMHPTEVPPRIHGYISSAQARATIRSALNDELLDYKNHIAQIVVNSPNVASTILSRWNAALDELGLTEIIRKVTTGYTSRLRGDESIISDILEESEISYGLRMSMHSTSDSGDGGSAFGLNTILGILWTDHANTSEEERCGKLKIATPDEQELDFYSVPLASHDFPLASIECFQATNLMLLEQKIKEIRPQMKKSLMESQEYKDFFEFILPYKRMATSLTIHGTTLLSGYGDMPTLLSSTKSGLAAAFAASTLVDPNGDNTFGAYPSSADVLASIGPTGFSGGEDPECFEAPDLGEWLKMLMEMIKEFIKYFPSIVFRNISDQIDPMYKEMKRHYLACELPDLRNGSWISRGGRYNKTPLGLYGSKQGEKKYLPVNINFPVDFVMGINDYAKSTWTDPTRLLLSLDRFIGYIFGGPMPLIDGAAAFKIPCAKIDASMEGWSKYKVGTFGRYGHSITPLNLIALQTLELPRDMDLRRSICQSREIPNPIICDDEE